jgi:hypothetical protein
MLIEVKCIHVASVRSVQNRIVIKYYVFMVMMIVASVRSVQYRIVIKCYVFIVIAVSERSVYD